MFPPTSKEGESKELGEFNYRHELHDYWENIQKQNRQAHLIEMIEARGGTIEYDSSRIIDEHKELARWIETNREKAWKMVRSPKMWKMYEDLLKEDEQEEQNYLDNVYDL